MPHHAATDDTRRRFMTHLAGLGLGTTLAPGVLWARMQDQGDDRITLDMVTDALKLAGIEATEEERRSMVAGANQALGRYEAVRQMDIPTACYPAINVPNGFASTGQPTNVVFYARPFGEMHILALAKAYQDAAGFHLKKPMRLDG